MFLIGIDFLWLCFAQENVGRREVDAADCKTVYLSEYAIPYYKN